MQVRAIKKFVRISRRKIDRLAAPCRGEKLGKLKPKIAFLPQKAARILHRLFKEAEANFIFKNPNADPDELLVARLTVDKGPTMKRIYYRAKGRADRIEKRSSHLTLVLSDESASVSKRRRKVSKGSGSSKQNPKRHRATKPTKATPRAVASSARSNPSAVAGKGKN